MGQTRKEWIDILNIIACIGVIMLHCSNHEIHNYSGNITLQFIGGCFTHTLFFWPVPIFLMISGANLLDYSGSWKRFYKRRFERTVIPFIIWSILYCILLHRNNLTINSFIQNFITGRFNPHMWFFIPLFAFYLSVPFLSCMVKNGGKKLVEYFLIIAFCCSSLLPFVLGIINVKYSNIFPLAGSYLLMPILGYYFVKYPIPVNWKKNVYQLAILGAIIHFSLVYYIIQYHNELKGIILNYDTPLSLLMASAVFIYFKDYGWKKHIAKFKINVNKIAVISSCSLGIYLLHYSIILILKKFTPFVYDILGFIGVYIISLCIIYIMKKIPVIKNIVP